MILSLITKEQYITLRLPNRKDGYFVLRDSGGEELFTVEGDGDWTLRGTALGRLPQDQPAALESGVLIPVHIRRDMQPAYLFAEEAAERYAKFARAQTPDTVEYAVGSASGNTFRCLNPYVSPRHCKLMCENRAWSVADLGSRTGTYVNGRRIAGTRRLSPGDVVTVMNQKFIVLPGLLAFNAQSIDVPALKGVLRPFHAPALPVDDPFAPAKIPVYFHRQPRFTDSVEGKDVSVAPPPALPGQEAQTPAILSYGPAVASGAAMLLAGMNPVSGLFMMASSILFPKLTRNFSARERKKQEARSRELFEQMLAQKEQELGSLFLTQTAALRKQTPDPRVEAETLLRDKRALWSHRPEHRDFLNLRLGLGDIPALVNIRFPQENREAMDDPLQQKLREFQARPRVLKDVPMVLEFGKSYSVGVSGDDNLRTAFAVQLIGQLAMHIGYDDCKLCLLGPLDGPLSCLRWLPHTWDDDRTLHLIAGDQNQLNRFLPELDRIVQAYRSGQVTAELVFLITDPELAHSGVLTRLLFDASCEHIHILTLARHSAQLPSRTDVAIGIREARGRMVWQAGEQRQTMEFRPDRGLDGLMARLAYEMANTFLDVRTERAEIPDSVPFLDLFGVRDVRRLNLLDRWDRADPASSLSTPIGVGEGGVPCLLDVNEKGDGSHGLVAGTTGSGKSELLMSYILSMAVNYSPREVAFALIDYKGGGMANAFAELPHTVGVITNLSGSTVLRAQASIDSEYKRRQRIFSETQKAFGMSKMEIGDYQRLYRAGQVSEPMPHLLIITDEFAELKTQEPDFMRKLLVPAARIGRSLGIHLILATQQPAGIVDEQIQTNTNFRLCLRMASAQDSQNILKTPAAAELERVGSFYKQVGTTLLQAQSAYTGAAYDPEKSAVPNGGVEVLSPTGAVLRRQGLALRQSGQGITQATAVTRHIIEVARREGIQASPLWLPELEERIPLSQLEDRYAVQTEPWVLEPVVGELDDPANQRRALVRLPLNAGKNAIVYGGIGSGKVMFLSAVLEGLMRRHTPEQLHIYILDYADDGLYAYLSAPHVGDVLTSDDDEKRGRFLDFLQSEIAVRKKKLGGALSALPLSTRLQEAGLCHILVVLHDLGNLKDRLDKDLDRFISMLKDGPRWGILFLATQESTSGALYQLGKCFPQRYALQMDRDDDYMTVLEASPKLKPSAYRGRGILRTEDGFREFQTATADEDAETLCARLKAQWDGPEAPPIRVMPEHVTAAFLAPDWRKTRPLHLPVGLDTKTLEPAYYPFDSRPAHFLLGKDSDRAAFLRGFLPLAGKAVAVCVLDPDGVLTDWDETACIGPDSLTEGVGRLYEEYLDGRDAMEAGQPLPPERRMLILPSLRRTLNALDADGRMALVEMLTKPVGNWTLFLGDTPRNLKELRYDPREQSWVGPVFQGAEGLYLGGGILEQTVFQTDGSGSLYESLAFPLGYTFRDGTAGKVKFVEE